MLPPAQKVPRKANERLKMVELRVQDYDLNKKSYYAAEKRLFELLGQNVPIDHVGSTAIPNIVGKNIIDILIGAKDSAEFERYKDALINEGFYASTNSRTDIYQFFASRQGETGEGDVHLHLVIIGTERYSEFLTLRNYLLAKPEEATAYSEHKKELLSQGITDRKLYRATKSKYVSELIERAKQYESKK